MITKKEKTLIYHQRIFLQLIYTGLGSTYLMKLGMKVVNQLSASTIGRCRGPRIPPKNFIIFQFLSNKKQEELYGHVYQGI